MEFTKKVPQQHKIPKPIPLSPQQQNFVHTKINQLLADNCIGELSGPSKQGWVSNFFLVPKKLSSSFHIILDLSLLNRFILYKKFKMTHIHRILDLISPNMWATSVDLHDAYHSFFVCREFWKYLVFAWQDGKKTHWFFWKSLPQGLTSSPRLFTKTVQAILAYLHTLLITICSFIDDSLVLNQDPILLIDHTSKVIERFEKCGFKINYKKSQLQPTQIIEFLGFIIDTVKFVIKLTHDKCHQIFDMVNLILHNKQKSMSIRHLAKMIGKIVATFPASNHAPLHYRHLERHKIQALRISQGN